MTRRTALLLLGVTSLASIVAAGNFTNPLINDNTPDPGCIWINGTYYCATTSNDNSQHDAFPIHSSTDLVRWTFVRYVFPDYVKNKNPRWSIGDMWAPELHHVNGRIHVYFTARHSNGLLSIGCATADGIHGPYTDLGAPLQQNKSEGVIDATYLRDRASGNHYLVWKVDGNAHGNPTPIFAAQLDTAGTKVVGNPILLISNDQPWEGPLVEGPWIIYVPQQQMYYLFYSANGYAGPAYAMGSARSKSALGPYVKLQPPANPIIHTAGNPDRDAWIGPGHCSVLTVGDGSSGNYFILYHGWANGHVGAGNNRMLLMDSLLWTPDGWPYIQTPQGKGVPSETSVPVPR